MLLCRLEDSTYPVPSSEDRAFVCWFFGRFSAVDGIAYQEQVAPLRLAFHRHFRAAQPGLCSQAQQLLSGSVDQLPLAELHVVYRARVSNRVWNGVCLVRFPPGPKGTVPFLRPGTTPGVVAAKIGTVPVNAYANSVSGRLPAFAGRSRRRSTGWPPDRPPGTEARQEPSPRPRGSTDSLCGAGIAGVPATVRGTLH